SPVTKPAPAPASDAGAPGSGIGATGPDVGATVRDPGSPESHIGAAGPDVGATGSDPSLLRFRAVLEAGLAALEARREEVNELNVFPVADGDTGDNMVLTLRAVLDELDRLAAASADNTVGRDQIVASVARAALLGARGTSGVILSQLIRGAAEE